MIDIHDNIDIDWAIEEIAYLNDDFADEENQDGQYIIGIYQWRTLLFGSGILPAIFFQFPAHIVLMYLDYNDLFYIRNPKISILRMNVLPCGTHLVIDKTHWLRLIQRHWRKTVQLRRHILRGRGSVANQRAREYTGKYLRGYQIFPGLRGMLTAYRRTTNTKIG